MESGHYDGNRHSVGLHMHKQYLGDARMQTCERVRENAWLHFEEIDIDLAH